MISSASQRLCGRITNSYVSAILSKGETLFLQGIFLTGEDPAGPVNLAMTWKEGEDDPWYIVTDQAANQGTLTDY
ncbi:MAG: hypothetical protein AB1611_12365 [bacterium]